MISFYCPECIVGWSPYQTAGGKCPECGGGTRRRQEPASDDSLARYKAAREAGRLRGLYAAFEEFYAEREAARDGVLGDTEEFPVVEDGPAFGEEQAA